MTRAENLLKHSLFLEIWKDDTYSLLVAFPEQLEAAGELPARSYREAIAEFCEKYGMEENAIRMIGFRYLAAERSHTYVMPYYEVLVANPEEPVGGQLDAEIYTCYERVLLPAVVL